MCVMCETQRAAPHPCTLNKNGRQQQPCQWQRNSVANPCDAQTKTINIFGVRRQKHSKNFAAQNIQNANFALLENPHKHATHTVASISFGWTLSRFDTSDDQQCWMRQKTRARCVCSNLSEQTELRHSPVYHGAFACSTEKTCNAGAFGSRQVLLIFECCHSNTHTTEAHK